MLFRLLLVAAIASISEPVVLATSRAPGSLDGPLVERVVRLVGQVLVSADASTAERLEAVRTLRFTRAATVAATVRQALSDSDRVVQLNALGVLVANGDTQAWKATEAALLDPLREPASGRAALVASIEDVSDETAIPSLRRLLRASEAATRRAAAYALRNTESPSAIPALVDALEDSDETVLYLATSGLASITRTAGHSTTADRFASERASHVQYWRTWASQRGLRP